MDATTKNPRLDPVISGGLLGAAAGLLVLHPFAALAAATTTGQPAFDAVMEAYELSAAGLLVFHILMGAVIGVAASSMVNAEFRRQLAREREAAALREQLLQSQKLESIGRLAAGVAHDFNNVLSALNIQLHLAQQGVPEDGPVAKRISDAKRIAAKGGAMSKQLLTFARKGKSSPKEVDLLAAVEDMQIIMKRLVGSGVQITVEGTPGITCQVDPGQLDQVLLNLVVNARDALDGRGSVKIRAAQEGDECLLEVSDNGPGIPDDVLPRLFEPFFTTKQDGRGNGLGLATSYGIVTQHGGNIEVDSRPGTGTTFRIRLPLSAGGDDLPAPVVSPTDAPAGSESSL